MSDPRDILINDFDYDLPQEKIAQHPLGARDESRLLVWRKGEITDDRFSSIHRHLPDRTLLIFNSSRVIRARIIFEREGRAPVEVFCLEPSGTATHGSALWLCLVGRLKSWRSGTLRMESAGLSLNAEVVERIGENVLLRFSWQPEELPFESILERFGRMPLPPYINRIPGSSDETRYQTVYASRGGSVAAPTAGLHFTKELISGLRDRGVETDELILHVGSGTFRPVKTDRLGGHSMHGEWFTVTSELLQRLAEHGKQPVVAVGTTTMRALESIYWIGVRAAAKGIGLDPYVSQWEPYEADPVMSRTEAMGALAEMMKKNGLNELTCRTSIIIAPPYSTRVVNGLITNFHQPRSTLLVLVAAFTGGGWKQIYRHALQNRYRFLSYGDSSLLLP